jgi:spermidine synthase
MFDIKSVPKIVIREGSIGSTKITKSGNHYELLTNDERWMLVNTTSKQELNEFYSSYDLAEGNVLLSGFGFGILPQWIASKESVKSVTVVELNQEVIDLFLLHNSLNPKIKIVVSDIRNYHDDTLYDWAIFDHYEAARVPTKQDFDLLSNNLNFKNLWFWSLEDKLENYTSWSSFKSDYSSKLPDLDISKLERYMNLLKYKVNLLH